MKSDYRATKDHNDLSEVEQRWFEAMDAGPSPASRGRENNLDSAAALLQTFESESLSSTSVYSASTELQSCPSSSSYSSSPPRAADSQATGCSPAPSSLASPRTPPISGVQQRKRKRSLSSEFERMKAAHERHQAWLIDYLQRSESERKRALEEDIALRREEAAREEALRRDEMAQHAALTHAFLDVLAKMVEQMGNGKI